VPFILLYNERPSVVFPIPRLLFSFSLPWMFISPRLAYFGKERETKQLLQTDRASAVLSYMGATLVAECWKIHYLTDSAIA